MWPFKKRCQSRFLSQYETKRRGSDGWIQKERVVRCQLRTGHETNFHHLHDNHSGIVDRWLEQAGLK